MSPGGTATFTVTATGTAPITYQWQKNTVNIEGATSSSYSIEDASEANEGLYRCVVTNVAGSVNSNEAQLTVSFDPGRGGNQSPRDSVGQPKSRNTTAGALRRIWKGLLSFNATRRIP